MFKKQKAFTLIELLVTVAVAAIVLGIAIPSFNSQISNSRSLMLGEDLAAALNFVRSEAVKRNAQVTLCASDNGANCTGDVWTDGYIAFVDGAPNDASQAPAVGLILKVWPALGPQAVIAPLVPVEFIRYTGFGTLARGSAAVELTARFANCKNQSARTITVRLSGAIDVARADCP